MLTNIYHMSYCKAEKQAYFHFWGCNMNCRGCLCQKKIYGFMLKENIYDYLEEPRGIADHPEQFMDFEEVMQILERLGVKWILFEGQEASLDPLYPQLTGATHKKFGSHNVLMTNAYKMPPLKDTDQVGVSLKAFTDSLHRHYTGKSNERVLKNFVKIYQSGVKLNVESVVIPDYIDAREIEHIAKFIASVDKEIPYHIDAYFKAGDNPWRRPTPEEMDEAVSLARRHLTNVSCFKGGESLAFEVVNIFPEVIPMDIMEAPGKDVAKT